MPYILMLGLLTVFLSCNTTDEYDNPATTRTLRNAVDDSFNTMIAKADRQERTVGTVYFAHNGSDLAASERERLNRIAQELNEYEGTVIVEGHADHSNTDPYNHRLGLQRAYNVADYLRSAGVWDERLYVTGYGEGRPVASNWTENDRSQNRRVEVKLQTHGEGMGGKEAIKANTAMYQKKETAQPKYKGSGISLFVESGK